MFATVLPPGARAALATLASQTILPPKTYLAGGTALALQLGHRRSFDFDFFTPTEFNLPQTVKRFEALMDFSLTRTAEGTILGSIPHTQISLFHYPYPLIAPTKEYQGVRIAGLLDLGAMKLNAIADRGLRRDFVDLAILLEQFALTELLIAYDRKFGNLASNHLHLLKSLVYFTDAEGDKQPDVLFDRLDWRLVKQSITTAVRKLR